MTNCPHCGSPLSDAEIGGLLKGTAVSATVNIYACGYRADSHRPDKCRIRELERTVQERDKTIKELSSDYNALVDMHEED